MMVINGRRSAVTWLDTYTTGIELKCNLSSPPIFPISRPSTESASPWPRSLADLADVQVMHYYLFLARDFLSFLSSKRQPPRSNLRPPANHPTLLQLHNPPKRLLRLPDLPTKLVRPRKRQPSLRIIPPDSQSRETGQKHVRALASGEADSGSLLVRRATTVWRLEVAADGRLSLSPPRVRDELAKYAAKQRDRIG